MAVRAKLIELFTRVVSVNEKDDKIYYNGDNNLYPNEVERVINNSPTASRAAKIMAKFIFGNGLADPTTDVIVNSKTGLKLSDIVAHAAPDIAYQNGVFFWRSFGINENGELHPNRLEVLDYSKTRISKEDDNENAGKIYFKDFEGSKKLSFSGGNKNAKEWFWPFSDDQRVILAQIKSDAKDSKSEDLSEMIQNYRGQVYYMNLTPRYKYALSPVDSVYNEADTEFRMSVYDNTQARLGFLGKTAVITTGLDEEAAKQVDEDVQKWLGAENSAGLLRIDVETSMEIDNVIKVIQLESQFDDQMFQNKKTHARDLILGAFNNIPSMLFEARDGLFDGSAEKYRELKLFYSEQTRFERQMLQKTLTKLGFPCVIEPIIEERKPNEL